MPLSATWAISSLESRHFVNVIPTKRTGQKWTSRLLGIMMNKRQTIRENWPDDGGLMLIYQVIRDEKDEKAVIDGPWTLFFPDSEKKMLERNYVRGILEGTCTRWNVDGSVDWICSFANDKPHCIWRHYGSNNTVVSQVIWNHGIRDGVAEHWFDDGSSSMMKIYDKGKRVGRWFSYEGSGGKKHEFSFVCGTGSWKQWHANGRLEIEGQFENNHPCGMWRRYNYDGELVDIKECHENSTFEEEFGSMIKGV